MKFKLLAVGTFYTVALSSSAIAAPDAPAQDVTQTSVAGAQNAQVEARAALLLTENNPVDVVRMIAQETPENAPLAIQVVHVIAPDASLESLVSAAFEAAPGAALEIASMALALGMDAARLPELAIAANIDPTIVAQATAAGIPDTQVSAQPKAPTVRRHPRGSGISPS